MRLEEYPGRLRYDYDYGNQKIISFPDPSTVHESTARFCRQLMASTMNPSLTLGSCGSIGVTDHDADLKSHAKGADEAYYVRSGDLDTIPLFPAFVIELGYSETVEDLLDDATRWLCQSKGHILAALVVNFNKPVHAPENFHDITK